MHLDDLIGGLPLRNLDFVEVFGGSGHSSQGLAGVACL